MSTKPAISEEATVLARTPANQAAQLLSLLVRDKLALIAAIVVAVAILSAVLGPFVFSHESTIMNLRMRNAAPFVSANGAIYVLGGDPLGRSILARIIVASGGTLTVAALSVFAALLAGTVLGLIAGTRDGALATLIMRGADVLMSFPSLLLAMIVLYIFSPGINSVILVMAITRMPVYIRVVRAETLEVRERMFVLAARTMGASFFRLVSRHILPVILPTLITVGTLELSYVMLTEASLSFLGLGIQPPQVSWGLMVSEGRNYLLTAWWVAFWPGLAIMLLTTSFSILSNWLRVATDPRQRWRLETKGAADGSR